MCKIVSFFSNKGGTGKTTLTYNVGADLAFNHKKKVLVIDLDSQLNLTASMFGLSNTIEYRNGDDEKWQEYLKKYLSFTEFINNKNNNSKIIFNYQNDRKLINNKHLYNNVVFELLTGDVNYFKLENTLQAYLQNSNLIEDARERFSAIMNKIKELSKNYDFILIDCSPSATSVLNALFVLSSDYFICPLRCDFFSYQSVCNLENIIGNWEHIFENIESNTYTAGVNFREKGKFIGIVVSETRIRTNAETDNTNISESSRNWSDIINQSIKSYTTSAKCSKRSITENDFQNIFNGATPFIITNETCNYTGIMKDIIDKAGIPLILLTPEISKKFYNYKSGKKSGQGRSILAIKNYKKNFEQYKKAINFISKGLMNLK